MILETYMHARTSLQPVIEAPGLPWPRGPVPPLPPVTDSPARPFETPACGGAMSLPLIVEEIELQDLHPAVFTSTPRDERIWADCHAAHQTGTAEADAATAAHELLTPVVTELDGAAHLECRDAVAALLPEVSEYEPDEAELALFARYVEYPPRFTTHSSTGAQWHDDERGWDAEAARQEAARQNVRVPVAPVLKIVKIPEWARHLEEFDMAEEIELQAVNMATLSRAAA